MEEKDFSSYDQALPENLRKASSSDAILHILPLHHSAPKNISPYIVKITYRAGDPVMNVHAVEDADHLILEEAPLVEVKNDSIVFVEDYTLEQVREDLDQGSGGVSLEDELPRLAAYPASRGYDAAVPLERLHRTTAPEDMFSALLSKEEPVLEAVVPIEDLPILTEASLSEQGSSQDDVRYEVLSLPRAGGWRLHLRSAVAFATIAALVVMPLQASRVFAHTLRAKTALVDEGSAGLSQFLRGKDALVTQNFSQASEDFSRANDHFSDAVKTFSQVQGIAASVVSLIPQVDRTKDTVADLLTIGEKTTHASEILSRGMVTAAQPGLSITERIDLVLAYLSQVTPDIDEAAGAASRLDAHVVPDDMRDDISTLREILPGLASSLHEVQAYGDALQTILGANAEKTYMLVFQNTAEVRPTGGFLGSFAEVSFSEGAMTKLSVPEGGTYDVQGQLKAFVSAPGPLQLLRARWEFQDANWFPDFPTSARKMLWFYESAGGPSVDGVLAVNATILPKLLEKTGPITLEDGRELNAENVLFTLQKEVEIDAPLQGELPKGIIGEVLSALFARVEEGDVETLLGVIDVFGQGFSTSDLQVYFSDNELQASMKNLGWTGEMQASDDDYLMVVHTNVGGGKTDTVIARDVAVDIRIQDDGTIENTVTLTQTHRGMQNEIFTGINNVDYVRLYVPEGSVLVRGQGFEPPSDELFSSYPEPLAVDEDLMVTMRDVYQDPETGTDIWQEQGKTVFGNWMQTAPGETQITTFTYRLPWNIHDAGVSTSSSALAFAQEVFGAPQAFPHALLFERQSGVAQSVLVRIHPPENLPVFWSSHDTQEVFIPEFTKDTFFGWILERS